MKSGQIRSGSRVEIDVPTCVTAKQKAAKQYSREWRAGTIFARASLDSNADRSTATFIWLLRYSGEDVPAAAHTFTGVIVRGDRCYLIWELFPVVGKTHRKDAPGVWHRVTLCHRSAGLSSPPSPHQQNPRPQSKERLERSENSESIRQYFPITQVLRAISCYRVAAPVSRLLRARNSCEREFVTARK